MDKLSFVALLIHPTSINQNSNELVTLATDFATAIPVVLETTLSSQVLISSVRGILIYLSQNVAGHGIHMVAQMWVVQLTIALHTVLLELLHHLLHIMQHMIWIISWQNEIYNILLQNYLIVINVFQSKSSIELNDCSATLIKFCNTYLNRKLSFLSLYSPGLSLTAARPPKVNQIIQMVWLRYSSEITNIK